MGLVGLSSLFEIFEAYCFVCCWSIGFCDIFGGGLF